jgi:hypothetical protein
MLADHPHSARPQLRIDLLRHDDILLDPNRSGIKPGRFIIELHRRIARGYRNRDNYRLRMLLVAGSRDPRPLPGVR